VRCILEGSIQESTTIPLSSSWRSRWALLGFPKHFLQWRQSMHLLLLCFIGSTEPETGCPRLKHESFQCSQWIGFANWEWFVSIEIGKRKPRSFSQLGFAVISALCPAHIGFINRLLMPQCLLVWVKPLIHKCVPKCMLAKYMMNHFKFDKGGWTENSKCEKFRAFSHTVRFSVCVNGPWSVARAAWLMAFCCLP
jgi:hypothetical protein